MHTHTDTAAPPSQAAPPAWKTQHIWKACECGATSTEGDALPSPPSLGEEAAEFTLRLPRALWLQAATSESPVPALLLLDWCTWGPGALGGQRSGAGPAPHCRMRKLRPREARRPAQTF